VIHFHAAGIMDLIVIVEGSEMDICDPGLCICGDNVGHIYLEAEPSHL